MLVIRGKVVDKEGNLIGYSLDDDGFKYTVTLRGLYEETIIQGLIDQGYTFYDYHGKITNPSGIDISELESFELSEDEDLEFIESSSTDALTEQEALRYFKKEIRKDQLIDFNATPHNYEINTRQEFISYLNRRITGQSRFTVALDLREINYFVAPEARFTIDEVSKDKEIREYIEKIYSFKIYNNLPEFKRHVSWLIEVGVLKPEDRDNLDAVTLAELSWGIPGINCNVINQYTETDATYYIGKSLSEKKINGESRDRRPTVGLMDGSGCIYYKGIKVDAKDIFEDYAYIKISDRDKYTEGLRTQTKWGSPYKAVSVLVYEPYVRYCMEIITEEGYTFEFRVDRDNAAIVSAYSPIMYTFNHRLKYNGAITRLSVVSTEKEIYRSKLLSKAVKDIVKSRSYAPAYKSSYEMLTEEGVSPEAALTWLCSYISQHPEINSNLEDLNYTSAMYMFKVGLPSYYEKAFLPEDAEYDSYEEMVNLMIAQRDLMIASNELEIPEYDITSKKGREMESNGVVLAGRELLGDRDYEQLVVSEQTIKPLELMQFVLSLRNGEVALNNLGNGVIIDSTAGINRLVDLMETVYAIRYSGEDTDSNFSLFLNSIESITEINMEEEFPERKSAYEGCLLDIANIRHDRAMQSVGCDWVVNVFNEISNESQDVQRHYAMDILSINLNEGTQEYKLMVNISNRICKEIDSKKRELGVFATEVLKKQAPYSALMLIYKIHFGKVDKRTVGDNYVIEESINIGDVKVSVDINLASYEWTFIVAGQFFERKFTTLYEYCRYEVRETGGFDRMCINAKINPWYVQPKFGNIGVYNFAVNFLSNGAFNSLPEKYRINVSEAGGRYICLSDYWMTHGLMPYGIDAGETEFIAMDPNYYLNSRTSDETMEQYYARFTELGKQANAKNEYVVCLPTKSDIYFKDYAENCGIRNIVETVFAEKAPGLSNVFLKQYRPYSITSENFKNQKAIETVGNIIDAFDVDDLEIWELEAMRPVLTGEFVTGVYTVMTDLTDLRVVNINTQEKVFSKKVADITLEDMKDLINTFKVAYQINATKCYIKAINTEYVLEVR